MAVEIITRDDLEHFRMELLEDIRKILSKTENTEGKKWLRSKEVKKLLNISPGTLQNLCLNGVLHPTKIVGINYFDVGEINRLLESKDLGRKTL